MSQTFDPLYRWLGIPPEEQPPDYYRLLGVRRFEDDPEVISNAADRQMLHVRSFQSGPRAAQCQRLLNELAAARTCLLDPAKKAVYDGGLPPLTGVASAAAPIPLTAQPGPQPVAAIAPRQPGAAENFPVRPSSRTNHARHGSGKSPARLVVEILGGGAVGVVIALAILWYGFGADPLGVFERFEIDRRVAELYDRASESADAQRDATDEGESTETSTADASQRSGRGNAASTSTSPARGRDASSTDGAKPPAGDPIDGMLELDQDPSPAGSSTAGSSAPSRPFHEQPLPQKHPPPTDEQQRDARQRLRDALGQDLTSGSSPEERRARLARLGQLANELAAEPDVLYVVLEDAYKEAGKLALYDDAGQIIERLIAAFEVNEIELRAQRIKDFVQAARLPADRMRLAADALVLAETAYRQEQFEYAASLADLAEGQAARAGNAAARTQARGRASEYKRAARALETYQKALATLDKNPDDHAAHETAGLYLTLLEGDFNEGLPHLAQANDQQLKTVAERDLAGAASAEDRIVLGDAWFDLATADPSWTAFFARARYWYRLAESDASGLSLVKTRTRLEQIDQMEAAGRFTDRAATPAAANAPPASSRPAFSAP